MRWAVQLHDIDVGYGDRTVLRAFSARVPSGGVTAVVGPGGSGKSTLLKVLAGDEASPRPWVRGLVPRLEAWRLPQPPRGRVGPARGHEAERLLDDWARRAGLGWSPMRSTLLANPVLLHRLASIVGADAPLLLLDEPDTGAGERDRVALADVLHGLAREGRTIVLVTHNVELACHVADHMVLLVDGVKLDEGAPQRIRTAPASDRVRAYLTWGG